MNEEEIIELVEELKENCQCWLEDEDTCADDRKWFEKEKIVLQDLLDLYKQEKEKNKKLEEEVKCFRDSYEEARIEECDTYFLMNKVIDMMAEELPINAEICDKLKDSKNDCYADIADEKACSKCIKEYYFNKVKENEK